MDPTTRINDYILLCGAALYYAAYCSATSLQMDTVISDYLKWDICDETRSAIQSLVDAGDHATLTKLLGRRLAFGTAGLRGRMGPGYSQMNNLVILQTMQGLLRYLEQTLPNAKSMGIIIGYDHRRKGSISSEEFARICAAVALAANFKVYYLEEYAATPLVPFGVLHYGCAAGVMVTASHNPKDDNGFKVYAANGAQIIAPHDEGIAKCIDENLAPWQTYACDMATLAAADNMHLILNPLTAAYFSSLSKLVSHPPITSPVTYTAMHGVGGRWMERAFVTISAPAAIVVDSQQQPDADFPTVVFPNPEEKGALAEAMRVSDENNCKIIIANDPDADRFALAEKHVSWRQFTGDEIGAMLGHFCMKKYIDNGGDPSKGVVLSSVVSSRMLGAMAEKLGFQYVGTLTGFKWLGNQAIQLQQQHGLEVVFMYEEALGYCCSNIHFDKDGITAAAVFMDLLSSLTARNMTIADYLNELYGEFGYFVSKNSYIRCDDKNIINSIFARLRNGFNGGYISACGDVSITRIRDVTTGYDSAPSAVSQLPKTPESEMIMFSFANGVSVILRTSGTEPKIKYYSEIAGTIGQDASTVRETLNTFVNECIDEFLQPEKYGLFK